MATTRTSGNTCRPSADTNIGPLPELVHGFDVRRQPLFSRGCCFCRSRFLQNSVARSNLIRMPGARARWEYELENLASGIHLDRADARGRDYQHTGSRCGAGVQHLDDTRQGYGPSTGGGQLPRRHHGKRRIRRYHGQLGRGLDGYYRGRISGGSVTNAGLITVLGNSATVGTDVTIVLTPSLSARRMLWECSTGATTATWKYVPAECRH